METNSFTDDRPRMQTVHFNRVAMQRGSDHVWTIHNTIGCFQVKRVTLLKPFVSYFRQDGPQPRAKFKGVGVLHIQNGEAYIK
jgi:hypothetical protein